VNLEKITASIVQEKQRHIRPNDRPLDIKPIVQAVAEIIISGRSDGRTSIMSDGRVKVAIGRVIPETNPQTTTARRKRFRKQLAAQLEPNGWKEVRPNVYERGESGRD